MSAERSRHRHFVALPLLVAAILATVAAGGEGVRAQGAEDRRSHDVDGGEAVTLVSGARAVLFGGADVDRSAETPILRDGTVLLSGRGIVELRAGAYFLVGMDGAYHATLQDGTLTVAALTTPVLAMDGRSVALVRAGMQWSANGSKLSILADGIRAWTADRKEAPLPEHFIRREIALLGDPGTGVLPGRDGRQAPSLLLVGSARRRGVDDARERLLGELRDAVEAGSVTGVQSLLADSELAALLGTDRGLAVVAVLLSALPEGSALRLPLLDILARQEDLLLVLSLHEKYRAEAWLAGTAELAREARAARIFAITGAPGGRGLHSALLAERLRGEIAALRAALDSPVPVFTELISTAADTVERAEGNGHPAFARLLAGAVAGASADVEGQLGGEAQAALAALRSFGQVDARREMVFEDDEDGRGEGDSVGAAVPEQIPIAGATDVHSAESFNPADVARMAEDVLTGAGGLFTVRTEIVGVAPHRAEVRRMVFASPAGDREASFTIDFREDRVRDIDLGDGRSYPYESGIEGFLEWVRR